jgi:hypothetical protein
VRFVLSFVLGVTATISSAAGLEFAGLHFPSNREARAAEGLLRVFLNTRELQLAETQAILRIEDHLKTIDRRLSTCENELNQLHIVIAPPPSLEVVPLPCPDCPPDRDGYKPFVVGPPDLFLVRDR